MTSNMERAELELLATQLRHDYPWLRVYTDDAGVWVAGVETDYAVYAISEMWADGRRKIIRTLDGGIAYLHRPSTNRPDYVTPGVKVVQG